MTIIVKKASREQINKAQVIWNITYPYLSGYRAEIFKSGDEFILEYIKPIPDTSFSAGEYYVIDKKTFSKFEEIEYDVFNDAYYSKLMLDVSHRECGL